MKTRVLIVDDEPLARERLKTFLEMSDQVEIAGESADGADAVAKIDELHPDLVFLDVQMPELNGFEVLEQIDVEARPAVVFVTAYDQFALRAFEVHAIDYLLKPFDQARFEMALERALNRTDQKKSGDLNDKLNALLANLQPQQRSADRLAIKSNGRIIFVRTPDIDWVEAADNYVNLHIGRDSHLLRETLSSLEQRLDPSIFLRISRSTIANMERIKELQPLFHGDYAVILKDGTRLTLSRNQRDKVQKLLGKLP